MNQRDLTTEEREQLDSLNKDVEASVKKRSAWLDAKMKEVASMKIGEEIYDIELGVPIGKVIKLYRTSNTSMSVHYEFEYYRTFAGVKYIGNTSGETRISLGSKEDAIVHAEFMAKYSKFVSGRLEKGYGVS